MAECVFPISMAFAIGPLACRSRVAARPSQNCASEYARLITVGALRPPFCDLMPVETAAPSVKACSGAWHDAHATDSSAERRLSKYRSRPSSTLSAEYGLLAGQESGGNPSGAFGPSAAEQISRKAGGKSAPAAIVRRCIGPLPLLAQSLHENAAITIHRG